MQNIKLLNFHIVLEKRLERNTSSAILFFTSNPGVFHYYPPNPYHKKLNRFLGLLM